MPEMNGYRFEEHVLRSSFHVNKRFHLRRFGARKHEVLVVEKHLRDNISRLTFGSSTVSQ